MLFAPVTSSLEVRTADDGSATVSGRFPYNTETELARGRFETFGPRAFRHGHVHLLAQHDYAHPLASTDSHTLSLRNDDDGLSFEARISADVAATTHGRDTLAMIRSGLAVGLSPGFRVATDGERVERRQNGLLRTIRHAELFELSVVTRPAYSTAQVEARSWVTPDNRFARAQLPVPPAYRWR